MNGELQAAIEARIMGGTTWMGVPALKNPCDAWVYQEIIWELQPNVIVEVGNKFGGSLEYLALIGDIANAEMLIGVDIDHSRVRLPGTENLITKLVTGDAIEVFPQVKQRVAGRSCLVIEDSAHTYDHTLAVLHTYGQLVQPGGYMICEDGVMPPVAEALKQFSMEQDDFVADRSREWPVTWNPGGYLRRVQP